MSPLWEEFVTKKQSILLDLRPSPKHISDTKLSAQEDFTYHFFQEIIKGISLFISRFGSAEASMTVEAAIVLPLFLVFFLALGSAMEMIRLHNNLEFALCEIGNRMSVYGYALTRSQESGSEENDDWLAEVGDIAFSYAYVKREIIAYLGEEYLDASPIVGGADGLQFLESEIFDGGDSFDIVVTYKVAPFGEIAGVRGFRMWNRYYGHLWNGYHIPTDVVYVAENGVVYHEDRMCSHLYLSVREVSLQKAYEERNSSGAKYKPCEYCGEIIGNSLVYITDEGDKIHNRRDCAGLKRTIFEMPCSEADVYSPCTRCAQK